MATNNIQENLKKYFYSGIGIAAHTTDVVKKSVQELVRKGNVSEADGKRIVAEALKKVEERRPHIEDKYNAAVHKFVKATTTEMTKLQKQVEKLEGQLRMKAKNSAGSSSIAKKSVAKVKSTVKKAAVSRKAKGHTTAKRTAM